MLWCTFFEITFTFIGGKKITAQVHEILILNGQEHLLACCPPIPENLDTIIKISDDDVEKQIINGKIDIIVQSTACWRGYIGTWEIKDCKFYLNDIVGRYKKVSKEPLFLESFSDVLIVPKGKKFCKIHMGFETLFKKKLHIVIKKGNVIQQVEICDVGKLSDLY